MPVVAAIKHSYAPAIYTEPLREEIAVGWLPNEEDRMVLENAAKEAQTEVITITEEAKQIVEKAQAEAEIKIAEAKKMAQQLVDEATLDWENRKAVFEKYDYDSVNDALKTKYFTDSELSESKQILEPIKLKTDSQEFVHPILKYMRN